MDTVARGEMVEGELDAFISKRDKQRRAEEGERREAEAWAESVARQNAAEREQNRWEWVRHFDRMAESHARLSQEYKRRADELCEKGTAA